MNDDEWIPSDINEFKGKLSVNWTGFLRSFRKQSNQTNRHKAKCTYCHYVLDGRPNVLFEHVEKCSAMSPSQKYQYYELVNRVRAESANTKIPHEKRRRDMINDEFLGPLKKELEGELHVSMVKSLLYDEITLNYFNNPFFIEFYEKLAKPFGPLPDKKHIYDIIHKLANDIDEDLGSQISSTKELMTLSIDSYHESNKESFFVTIHPTKNTKYCLGCFELYDDYKVEDMLTNLNSLLIEKSIPFIKIGAIITSSNKKLSSLRKSFINENKHILDLTCYWSVVGDVIQHILQDAHVVDMIQQHMIVINFFLSNKYWYDRLVEWGIQHHISYEFVSYQEYNLLNIIKVCLIIQEYYEGLLHCCNYDEQNQSSARELIPAEVIAILNDSTYNTSNTILLSVLNPFVAFYHRIATHCVPIDCVWKELIICYNALHNMTTEEKNHDIWKSASTILSQLASQFNNANYLTAFFLNPKYRKIALSKSIEVGDLIFKALQIAQNWKFNALAAGRLVNQIQAYAQDAAPFNEYQSNKDSYQYWSQMATTEHNQDLKSLALTLLSFSNCSHLSRHIPTTMYYLSNHFEQDILKEYKNDVIKVKMSLHDEISDVSSETINNSHSSSFTTTSSSSSSHSSKKQRRDELNTNSDIYQILHSNVDLSHFHQPLLLKSIIEDDESQSGTCRIEEMFDITMTEYQGTGETTSASENLYHIISNSMPSSSWSIDEIITKHISK